MTFALGARGQETVTISTETGNLTQISSSTYYNLWSSTKKWSEESLTFGTTSNNITTNNTALVIYPGNNECTYTITAPKGYVITNYSFNIQKYGNYNNNQTPTLTISGNNYRPKNNEATKIEINNIYTNTAIFTESGSNNGILLTDFVVTIAEQIIEPGIYTIHNYNNLKHHLHPRITNGNTNENDYINTQEKIDNFSFWRVNEVKEDNQYYYTFTEYSSNLSIKFIGNNYEEGKDKVQMNKYEDSDLFKYKLQSVESDNLKINIIPKGSDSDNSFNPHGGVGQNIGLYGKGDNGSIWKFVPAKLPSPSITTEKNNITISHICSFDGLKIYYTTNGTEPTTSSNLYSQPFDVENGTTIKAIAVLEGFESSEIVQETINIRLIPRIEYDQNGNIKISTNISGTDIYYTTNGTTPTTSSSKYNGNIEVTESINTIQFFASKDGYDNSDIIKLLIIRSNDDFSSFYESLTSNNSLYGVLYGDIEIPSNFSPTTYSGNFDGRYHTISGLTKPLFNTLNNGTVKNVVLDNVQLSSAVTVNDTECLGAIAAYASGNTKIYNCGILSKDGASSVSGGANTGSLVGYITGNTRVVNNYSYANVSGGGYVGGIVGRVAGTALSNSNYSNDNHCAVTNNMFYGNLSGTSNVSPVYAGNHTSNIKNTNEYNFWRSKAEVSYKIYNNQLAIDKDSYLNRFPFYRHIQNTHRELAAIYLFGSRTDATVAEIGHWYNVKNDEKVPYPIIEEWQTNTKRTTVDIENNLPDTNEKYSGKLLDNIGSDGYYTGTGEQVSSMGSGGYLTVNVSINGSDYTSRLPITDMDTLNYDFTWGKVVLPFANEYEGWTRDYSKICTGWMITSITGGTTGSLTNYNFADRDSTAKDLYSNSNYIFAQGGNYIVPYGVTAINIEANFANAFYLSDAYYDYGYDASYGGQTGLTTQVPTTYHGQTVYTNLNTLINAMSPDFTDPHSQAIVLVGNYHYNQNVVGTCFNTDKAVTIMSVDEDCNQEPDYGWYSYHTTDRTQVPPIRFDFVPNIGIGMAARTTGSNPYPTIGIWHAHGWFELTETCVSIMNECEISKNYYEKEENGNNRWIANSGYFLQIVYTREANCENYSYVQLGGNAYVEQFYPGPHVNNNNSIKQCPVVVTGGEIEECYMTGKGASSDAKVTGTDIYFWCAGGRIHKYLSAFMVVPSNINGVNVTAKVDHARIYRFFGGGTSPTAPITGNINITMNNSLVDFYCGGPEFGNMSDGKTVTTKAFGSTFGQFYGAGFGGTAITYKTKTDATYTFNGNHTFNESFDNYINDRLKYTDDYGYGTCYDFDYILYSGGAGKGVGRIYVGYADFSLAQTGNVTNSLQNCTIIGDFYGGGCQGTVAGTVKSTLTNCTLQRNAFGGGFKAAANEVKVYPKKQPAYSVYTKETGIFSDFGIEAPEIYTWQYNTSTGSDEGKKFLYTTTDMSQLGNVTDAITLDIKGGTVAQSVFGGGNESPSRDNTTVIINEGTVVRTNVFGGGNIADVDGSTQVSIESGNINKNVYGAGAGNLLLATAGQVKKNVTVDITGGTIGGNVYGGGAIANSNVDASTNSSAYTTKVNLTGGLIKGDAFGGGEGTMDYDKDDSEQKANAAALVYGDVTVVLDGTRFELKTIKDDNEIEIPASGRIFGCNNINGSPKGTVLVNVQKTVGKTNKKPEDKGKGIYELHAVYGGGNLAAYNPTNPKADGQFASYKYGDKVIQHDNKAKPVQVVIDGCDETSIEYVYGGGNAAATPATDVTILGSYEIGNVFGGGNGKDRYTLDGGNTWNENEGADVGIIDAAAYASDSTQGKYGTGYAMTSVLGGTVNYIYGGSNTKGNIVGEATAYLDKASDCSLVVNGIYGGGNEAYMDGKPNIVLGCIDYLKEIYGGSRNADVGSNINITITSGHFDRVFGGNNLGGAINGSITVNIEETGCNPITIGEVYGGGNKAAYSVYGYEANGKPKETGEKLYSDPVVNIRSFTSIGRVFGGGLGEEAIMVASPTVNINEVKGVNADNTEWKYLGTTIKYADDSSITLPTHSAGAIGAIQTVFGGGNAAKVIGNTHVNIGTQESVIFRTPETNNDGTPTTEIERTHKVEGADIRENVYGGGNKADVTGKTNVTIGQQPVVTP